MGNKRVKVLTSVSRVLGICGFFAFSPAAFSAQEVPIGVGPLTLGGSSSALSISSGYLLGINGWLQIGAQGYLQSTAAKGASNRQIMLLIGPQFNFGGAYPEAFTVQAGLAWRKAKTNATPPEAVEDSGGVGFGLLFGKRFPMAGTLALHPVAGIVNTGSMSFVLMPAQISLNF